MKTIADKIKSGKKLVSDGAWGTFLQKKGLAPGECPEQWNITHPDDVLDIANSYIKAGADMIETNSFGGNRFKLKFFGLQDQVYSLNKAAAQISRKAAGNDRNVLGSIGPTGKLLMMGDVTAEELYDAFKEQAIALAEGGADALVIETMSDIDEAICAVKACAENTSCEIICTFTFEKSAEKTYHTMMGVTPAQMTEAIVNAGATIIGANCGNGIEGMIEIVEEIRSANPDIPVLVHANAGLPILKDGETFFPESPEQMASYVNGLMKAGANIIGGCCGTTPDHICHIAEIVHKN
jgi:5-methyltetrahydrofolate--homocysteine methyltransferase